MFDTIGHSLKHRHSWLAMATAGSLSLASVVGVWPLWEAMPQDACLTVQSPMQECAQTIEEVQIDSEGEPQQPGVFPRQRLNVITPSAGQEGLLESRPIEVIQRGGRLGIRVQKPSDALVSQLGLEAGKGLLIEGVDDGSAASTAGLKIHDILLEFNGKPVQSKLETLIDEVKTIDKDKSVEAVVLRQGKRVTIKGIKLPEKKPATEGDEHRGPLWGRLQGDGFKFQAPPGIPQLQPVPLPQLGPWQWVPGMPAIAELGAGKGVMISIFRSGDSFTSRHQEGSLIITVTGSVKEGKTNVSNIQIQDGNGGANRFESLEKVPEQYREKVKNILDMSEKNSSKIEVLDIPVKPKPIK